MEHTAELHVRNDDAVADVLERLVLGEERAERGPLDRISEELDGLAGKLQVARCERTRSRSDEH